MVREGEPSRPGVQRFERDFFTPGSPFTVIGQGELGGKAAGLAAAQSALANRLDRREIEAVEIAIPFLTVIATDHFEAFVASNRLLELVAREPTDDDIARAFLAADLPATLVGDLRSLALQVRQPLAVRSSSLLEDATHHPFAGVYVTKMIPNEALDVDTRYRKLVEAIKLVWASTFYRAARDYRAVIGVDESSERMAVILQEVVGRRHGSRFYPDLSAVGRSYNYYPSGHARPEDGVGELALGLGKTIVDGEPAWSYSPAFPKSPPPYNDLGELLENTQTEFWAVNMGPAPYDPARETEYLVRCPLADAEADDVLRLVASTYDPSANRLVPGVGRSGPRLLNFAPLLQYGLAPVNAVHRALLDACAAAAAAPVEIELAWTLDPLPGRCGFLQMRSMVVPGADIDLQEAEMHGDGLLVASTTALGHGSLEGLRDVVYVRPDRFDPARTPEIAREIEPLNAALVRGGRPYLLLGFGRWGSSDARGGVPVGWAQIGGARAIVEVPTDELRGEPSQGSHFFHNLTAFRVLYLTVDRQHRHEVDWAWLERQPAELEGVLLRHVRLDRPLVVKVDGRTRRGVVRHD